MDLKSAIDLSMIVIRTRSVIISIVLHSEWCGVTRGTVIGSEAWKRAGPIDRQGLFVGVGRMAAGRSELFRLQHGVALVMDQPVFRVPSVQGEYYSIGRSHI